MLWTRNYLNTPGVKACKQYCIFFSLRSGASMRVGQRVFALTDDFSCRGKISRMPREDSAQATQERCKEESTSQAVKTNQAVLQTPALLSPCGGAWKICVAREIGHWYYHMRLVTMMLLPLTNKHELFKKFSKSITYSSSLSVHKHDSNGLSVKYNEHIVE